MYDITPLDKLRTKYIMYVVYAILIKHIGVTVLE